MAHQAQQRNHRLQLNIQFLLVVLAVALVCGVLWVDFRNQKRTGMPMSRLPYVDGEAAVEQVSNFYAQYLAAEGKPEVRAIAINGFGNANLAFYAKYYQHGFDPITCSVRSPESVRATLLSAGTTAKVQVVPVFEAGEGSALTATVVLDDGMHIDSVDCGNPLGGLDPGVQMLPAN